MKLFKKIKIIFKLQFPEGAIQRPSDLTINDDGKLAVVSLTGQCFMFDVKPGDKSQEFPTRGPRPAGGYRFFSVILDSSWINLIIQVSAEDAAEAVVVVDVAVATFAVGAEALAVVAVAVAGK